EARARSARAPAQARWHASGVHRDAHARMPLASAMIDVEGAAARGTVDSRDRLAVAILPHGVRALRHRIDQPELLRTRRACRVNRSRAPLRAHRRADAAVPV